MTRRIGFGLSCALFVMLVALAVRSGWTAGADRALLLGLAPPAWLVPLAEGLTWLGDAATRGLIAAAACLGLIVRRDWRRALAFAAIVAGGAALNSATKLLVDRARPDLLPHLDVVTSLSFPSGHAANGAILYLSLALLVPRGGRRIAVPLALALIAAIGWSRVALAVHWPSDVVAGWALGLGWVLLWRRYLERPAPG